MHEHENKYTVTQTGIQAWWAKKYTHCPPTVPETPGGRKRGPSRDCLSSLEAENIHTLTHTHTEWHDANATVGYADYSADCAHWEAAAGKVASSFWSERRIRGVKAEN